jgi:hypothetical protein
MADTMTLLGYGGAGPARIDLTTGLKIYFQKTGAFAYGATGAILVSDYNEGTHIISAANADLCETNHHPNLEEGTTTAKVKIAGEAEVTMTSTAPTINQCWNAHLACSPDGQVTAWTVFAYKTDGAETDTPVNCTVKAMLQGAANPVWGSIGGSAAALSLGTSASAATHDKYFGLCVTPSARGSNTNITLKLSATIV